MNIYQHPVDCGCNLCSWQPGRAPVKYACTECNQGWDHEPEGAEEYGCTQEVETDEGVVNPHNFLAVDEWKQRKIEQGWDDPQVTTDVVPAEQQFFTNDPLTQALANLSDEELARLAALPICKVWNEMVEGVIVPNRATRRAARRKR